MKYILTTIITLGSFLNGYSQVGIGTQNPQASSALDITSSNKGVLIPRVALISTDSKTPLSGNIPNGTMVFNTANSGSGTNAVFPTVYVWNNTEWVLPSELGTTKVKAVKFTNSPTSITNFNPATVASPVGIDIFSSASFNDDPAIFEKINDYQLKINQAGLYLISLNLALKQVPAVDQSRLSDYIYFNVNGNLASSKLITLVPQYNPADVNINGRFAFGSNSYVSLTAGQVITVHSQRYKDGTNYNGVVNYDSVSLSSITIVKLQ